MSAVIRVGTPPPSVGGAMNDGFLIARAAAAADGLPAGSVRVVVAELREAVLKLLGLHFQRADRIGEDAETLDRCETVGHLTVGGLREILHAANHVSCDRDRVKRSSTDQQLICDGGSDEHLQPSERCDHGLDRISALIEAIHQLVGELQIARDPAGINGIDHDSSPSLIVDSASVGERPGPVAEAGPGQPPGVRS